MKKFIYLANVRLPTEKAHGLQIMKMCEAFVQNGVAVELWVPHRFNKIKEDPFIYYGLKSAFKIRYNFCLDLNSGGFLGQFGYLVETFSFLITAKIKSFFNKDEIFYSREAWASLFFKNCILEIHDLPNHVRKTNLFLWHRARKIIVLTSYLQEELCGLGLVKEKIMVAADGVDLEEFQIAESKEICRQKIGLPLGVKIIMYVGSFQLYDWKGVDVLLGATRLLPKGILTVLVGGTANEIQKLKKLYPFDNFILRERISHQMVPVYLRSADILVLPNKSGNITSERYTSPLKLFEYLASGVPIIASDLPSIREVLDESNSILFEPNGVKSLATAIIDLLNNNDIVQKLSLAGQATAKQNTWRERARAIINFLGS